MEKNYSAAMTEARTAPVQGIISDMWIKNRTVPGHCPHPTDGL